MKASLQLVLSVGIFGAFFWLGKFVALDWFSAEQMDIGGKGFLIFAAAHTTLIGWLIKQYESEPPKELQEDRKLQFEARQRANWKMLWFRLFVTLILIGVATFLGGSLKGDLSMLSQSTACGVYVGSIATAAFQTVLSAIRIFAWKAASDRIREDLRTRAKRAKVLESLTFKPK